MKGSGEIVEQVEGARITMRLKKHVHAAMAAGLRRCERGANFGGVMPVVVNQRDSVRHTAYFETSADAREFAQAFADHVRLDVQFERDGDGCGGIQDVVF